MHTRNTGLAVFAAVLFAAQPVVALAATPVAEARKLVRRMTNTKNMRELPPLFTNETAAGMGIMFGGMLILTAAMADAMSGAVEGMADAMGQALDGAPPATPPGSGTENATGDGIVGEETGPKHAPRTNPPDKAAATSPEMARVKALANQVERVFAKHGVPMQNPDRPLTPQERRRIIGSGRALLADVIRVMEQMPKSKGSRGEDMFEMRKDIPVNKLKYRQISRTRVQIVDPSAPKTSIEARLESGAWRLHLGDAVRVLDSRGMAGPSVR